MRAFRLAYDGRPFRGFQRQPDVRTVEGTLLAGLRELELLGDDESVPPGYAAAGRTDAGVSAVAQTVAFEAPDWCAPRALNGALPAAVRAWASADVPDGFHATHDAARREYTYYLPAADADLGRARAAAERLSGEHDFHNLTTDDEGTVRELAVSADRADGFLELTVAGGGFPRELVRRLATLVGDVARGDAPADRVERALADAALEGAAGIGPAPAAGLVLTAVDYPGIGFEVDRRALAEARATFEDRAWTARTESRAMGRVLDGLGD
ncbi:MAG: tRNA pseudouridine(38-40) synthase TruA [Halobacteriales archaeon]|nr:tRNA pseudouridine(38-40) synthase TruA [Halobacteriales archaeon]